MESGDGCTALSMYLMSLDCIKIALKWLSGQFYVILCVFYHAIKNAKQKQNYSSRPAQQAARCKSTQEGRLGLEAKTF